MTDHLRNDARPLRFKRPALWLASLLACTSTNALNLNPDGYGQVLIFPYYTVNGGQSTLLSLQNHTPYGKALRVRIHEAQNGRDLREFNLYLAPRDVWTASVFSLSEDGGAMLSTDDESCTVPAIKHNTLLPQLANGRRYLPLSNFAYTGSNNDAGTDALSRNRSGHIEVIEMGIVTNGEGPGAKHTLDAISVGGDGSPRDCDQVINAWTQFTEATDTYWRQAPVGGTDLLAPTAANGGGYLVGSAGIVNFSAGTQLAYQADAIEAFSVSVLHSFPDIGSKPQLSDANWPTADGATAQWFDDGVLQTARYPRERAIDAVSALFTHDVLHNEFVAMPPQAVHQTLASEWVLTFPTKRFYVDPQRTPVAIAPFSQRFAAIAYEGFGAGVGWHARQRDRDGFVVPDGNCYDPGQQWDLCLTLGPMDPRAHEPRLFDEANVIAIGQAEARVDSAILAAPRAERIWLDWGIHSGALTMQLWSGDSPYFDGILDRAISRPDLDGHRLVGLPVTGFWVEQTSTNSVLANYAGLWRHRGTRCRVPVHDEAQAVCPGHIPIIDR